MQSTLQMWSPDCRADLGDARCTFPIWPDAIARETAYEAGDFVRVPTDGDGSLAEHYEDRIYECVTAGTTAEEQPEYDTTIGNDTEDGTAEFRAHDAFTRAAAVAAVENDRELDVDASLDAYDDDRFNEGLLVWETGANAGVAYEVKDWTAATRRIEMWSAARLPIEVGDKFRVSPGCHKRVIEDCRDRFRIEGSLRYAHGNVKNFRGEPYVPGSVMTAIQSGS
jgi:hypothetical protein